MFQPVGSLPPNVYWRRRILVAVVILAVVLLVWVLYAAGGAGGGGKTGAAATASATASAPSASSSASGRAPLSTITPSPGTARPPGSGGGAGNGSGEPSDANGQQSDANQSGANQSGAASGGGPQGPTCPDSALKLSVDTDRDKYRVGDQPVISLTLTNTSATACSRDVGAAQQEAVVSASGDSTARIWSSNDCDPGGDPNVRVLEAGASLHFSVTWAGTSSKPGCPSQHDRAGAGDYAVTATVGSLHSDAAKFSLS